MQQTKAKSSDSIEQWMNSPEANDLMNDIVYEGAPEVVKQEEKSPEYANLKEKIADYEELLVYNAMLSDDNYRNGLLPKNVVARQKILMDKTKDALKTNVASILRSAKNDEEKRALIDFLGKTIKDPFLRDSLLDKSFQISTEEDKQEELKTKITEDENSDFETVVNKSSLIGSDIKIDTPDVGASYLTSKSPESKSLEKSNKEINSGLKEDDPLLGDSESSSFDRPDIREIRRKKEEAREDMTEDKKKQLAEAGIRVVETPDKVPVEMGYGDPVKHELHSSPAEKRIEEIKTGFKEELDISIKQQEALRRDVPFPKEREQIAEKNKTEIEEVIEKIDEQEKIQAEKEGSLPTSESPQTVEVTGKRLSIEDNNIENPDIIASYVEKEVVRTDTPTIKQQEALRRDVPFPKEREQIAEKNKTEIEEVIEKIDEQEKIQAEKEGSLPTSESPQTVEASLKSEKEEKRPTGRGFFTNIWNTITKNKNINADTLSALNNELKEERSKNKTEINI